MQERPTLRWLVACAVVSLAVASGPRVMNAQSPPAQTAPLRFEVASLKPRGDAFIERFGFQISPGRVINRCANFKMLMSFAYHLDPSATVILWPGWASPYCTNALRGEPFTYEFQATMPPETNDAEMRQMMQTFLADRFKLAVHVETRDQSGYQLVQARGGFKLKPTNRDDDRERRPMGSLWCPEDDPRCRLFALGSNTTAQLVTALSMNIGRTVVDRSGLPSTETYFFDLKWASPDNPNSSLPSLFGALQEKFGLELKPFTGPVDTYFIDHVERPSPD